MPGYQPFASVNPLTGGCGPNFVQYPLNGSPGASKQSWNGYVSVKPNAAFDDCGRDGRLLSADGSLSAATPCRRSGSKCESTISRPPLVPMLGGAKRLL